MKPTILFLSIVFCTSSLLMAQTVIDHDEQLQKFFEAETVEIEQQTRQRLASADEYQRLQETYREQLASMLGLSPYPEKTPLQVTVTGEIVEEDFRVKNLHYQAMPGFYVTANLYLPVEETEPVPAILYGCGHARNVKDGLSYGNKVSYQHHGIWFAQNGYACLVIDTVQLGEFQGIHHGTYRHGMWWWNARGYTPAGVEAWAGIRGIDYLQSLPEVDPERIGVTGRSGGGAYSWWIAALDKRVQAAVPVAGITSMRNHIVDGCIEGHCDCMYQVNTRQWDYAMVSALVAPRPLLIVNTDKDRIFPLDGVMDVYWQTRMVYDHFDAADNLGIAISEGPHKDTQRLQVNAFEWFDRFLKEVDRPAPAAEKMFEPSQLQVFQQLPEDERTSTIHETFVPQAVRWELPESEQAWKRLVLNYMVGMRDLCFAGWERGYQVEQTIQTEKLESSPQKIMISGQFLSQAHVPLTFLQIQSPDYDSNQPTKIQLHVTETNYENLIDVLPEQLPAQEVHFVFAPRGLGPHAWSGDERTQTHIRRRFALLGQSLDSMRVWDLRQMIRTAHAVTGNSDASTLTLHASGEQGVNSLYATLYETPRVSQLELTHIPPSHDQGPIYLNVLRFLDIPQTLALAAWRTPIHLHDSPKSLLESYHELQQNDLFPMKSLLLSSVGKPDQ